MVFICYPKCTTCQKAKAYLNSSGVQYEQRDIKGNNPSYDELKAWFDISGLPIKKFFNTSGMAYKALNLKDKLPVMSVDDCLRLLSTDGMLVKRPMLIGEDFVLVGFKQDDWKAVLPFREKV
ncbi:MAG: arsenate reductase family protein [Eubacteriales bacterium]|nr:arsenate reductase family protein [Eubacteriales bacterium]